MITDYPSNLNNDLYNEYNSFFHVSVPSNPKMRLALNVMHKLLDEHHFKAIDFDTEQCECGETRENPVAKYIKQADERKNKWVPYPDPFKKDPIVDDEFQKAIKEYKKKMEPYDNPKWTLGDADGTINFTDADIKYRGDTTNVKYGK